MHWVLLRGLMREARHWGEFPEALGFAFPGSNVSTPDLPGNGRRFEERSPASISAMVEHLRQDLHRQGFAPPYHLLALSLGGMMAAHWSARYPGEVTAAVLINTSMRPNPFYHRLRPANYPAILNLALHGANAALRERTILRLASSATARPAVLAAWQRYAQECPVSRTNALRQLFAAARFRAPAAMAHNRLLLLASAGDWLVNPTCSHALAKRWNASLVIHSFAGHDLPLDDSAWVIEQVHRWAAATAIP